MRTTRPTTSWHVIETWGTGQDWHRHSYTIAPRATRVLRWVAAPYLETHRIAAMSRQRVNTELSIIRLTLEPRFAVGAPVVLAAMMIQGARHGA